MVFLQPADFIPDAQGSCAICPSRELHQLRLTSPPKPAKASLKQSLEIFKNLDLELSSLCDVDYTICCCHPLISLSFGLPLPAFTSSRFFPTLDPKHRGFLTGLLSRRLCAKSTFPPEPNYKSLWGHWLQRGARGVVDAPF